MRILALTSWWPEPADNGSRMRIMNLLRTLCASNEVHLLALSQQPVAQLQHELLDQMCASVAAVQQREYTPQRSDMLTSLWQPQPAFFRATWNPEYAALVQQTAMAHRPAIVVAFELSAAPYASLVSTPRVLEGLELTYLLYEFQRQHGLQRLRSWMTWAKHRGFVTNLLKDFDACTVVSSAEQALVNNLLPTTQCVVIPNGADLAGSDDLVITPQPDTLIYPGALSFQANLDAMQYFLGDIFPQIRMQRPATIMRITGRVQPEQIQALPSSAGVEFTGFLPDIRTAIAQSYAEVVPLRQGGGTRLKVLEAMALGTPIVATSKAVEGIELVPGQHALIADTAAAFAATTIRLLEQPGLREHLVRQARTFVKEHYDWRIIGDNLLQLLNRFV